MTAKSTLVPKKPILNKLISNILKSLLGAMVLLIITFLICDYFFPLKVNIDYSQTIYDKNGKIIHAFLSKDYKWRLKVSNDEISPLVKNVFLEKEDRYFYYHYGFNPMSICRALTNNILQQKKTSGASTITMQVARLLQPKKRTYTHKIVELFRAVQIENQYSKEEILNMYFNLIPYGGNIEGIKSVSLLYLQKNTLKLSLAEAVALAIIPNRPSSLNIKKNHDRIIKERNKWLLLLSDKNIFPNKDINDAITEPFSPIYKTFTYIAPHLSIRLTKELPHISDIHTHIDAQLQQKVNYITKNYVNKLKKYNIYNAAALVINNETNNVMSYVGSNDFFDYDHAGQCDGVTAMRSPGSTLKPLLYAMAFDKGLLTLQTSVDDVPCDINGYAPSNFDKKFRGRVSVETALLYSLNIPAVKVIDDYDVKSFVDKLITLNFNQIKKDKDKLGHSVILGGCGATLEELTNLYLGFAHDGKFTLSLLTRNQPASKAKYQDMVSESASYLISHTLSKLTRPDIPNYSENIENTFKIAWKTGTSYGKRDAWCIGYNKNYTVGVWLGNFDNSPAAELTGVDLAAPLLFEIFKSINYRHNGGWYVQPSSLVNRIVCTESGLPPNHFCKSFTNDLFIPGISDNSVCDHMIELSVSADEKQSYCMDCTPEVGYKKILYPKLSAEMVHYYDSRHIIYKKIPEHNPKCKTNFHTQIVKIIHPQAHKIYYTDEEFAHIKLECSVGPSVRHVYWYVNDKFIGKYSKSEEVFIKLKPQISKISCTDDLGNTGDVIVNVQGI